MKKIVNLIKEIRELVKDFPIQVNNFSGEDSQFYKDITYLNLKIGEDSINVFGDKVEFTSNNPNTSSMYWEDFLIKKRDAIKSKLKNEGKKRLKELEEQERKLFENLKAKYETKTK